MSAFSKALERDAPKAEMALNDLVTLGQLLTGEAPRKILEICQDWGHLSLCLAALLQDQKAGTLTTFTANTDSRTKHMTNALAELGLKDRVFPLQSGRSYTWALQRILKQGNRKSFDVCVLNGNKSWDASGFGIVLADMMLRQGGLMVLCGHNWSMARSPYFLARPQVTQKYESDELNAQPVRLAGEIILPHLGYDIVEGPEAASFLTARKL